MRRENKRDKIEYVEKGYIVYIVKAQIIRDALQSMAWRNKRFSPHIFDINDVIIFLVSTTEF